MRSDSPPPSWYEPVDLLDDIDHDDVAEPEALVVAHGVIHWTCGDHADD